MAENVSTTSPLDRRTVTVLFADIVRSTQLIQSMDAEVASNLLRPVLNVMRLAVERYGGTVIKLIGDGRMGVFGVPTTQEDHAARACHAALAIQTEVGRIAKRHDHEAATSLRVRVGFNSGLVVVATSTQ